MSEPVIVRPSTDMVPGVFVPERPEGTRKIVMMKTTSQRGGAARRPRLYEVIKEDGLDGLVLIVPLAVDDGRDPTWVGAHVLIEVPGAFLDAAGYVRIPTRELDPDEPIR